MTDIIEHKVRDLKDYWPIELNAAAYTGLRLTLYIVDYHSTMQARLKQDDQTHNDALIGLSTAFYGLMPLYYLGTFVFISNSISRGLKIKIDEKLPWSRYKATLQQYVGLFAVFFHQVIFGLATDAYLREELNASPTIAISTSTILQLLGAVLVTSSLWKPLVRNNDKPSPISNHSSLALAILSAASVSVPYAFFYIRRLKRAPISLGLSNQPLCWTAGGLNKVAIILIYAWVGIGTINATAAFTDLSTIITRYKASERFKNTVALCKGRWGLTNMLLVCMLGGLSVFELFHKPNNPYEKWGLLAGCMLVSTLCAWGYTSAMFSFKKLVKDAPADPDRRPSQILLPTTSLER